MSLFFQKNFTMKLRKNDFKEKFKRSLNLAYFRKDICRIWVPNKVLYSLDGTSGLLFENVTYTMF